jgi:tetratricopeptide (TPR) repeat protein
MLLRLLPILLLLPLTAPLAQPAPPPAAARGVDARRAELDRAFEALRIAPDEAAAARVEARIRALWAQAASPAVALLIRRGARNMGTSAPADALEDFDAAITLAPDFAEGWHLRGQAHARSGDLRAAARDLAEALRLEPRHWGVLLTLSAIQEEAGDLLAALRSLDAALAIDPRMPGGTARREALRRRAEGEDA